MRKPEQSRLERVPGSIKMTKARVSYMSKQAGKQEAWMRVGVACVTDCFIVILAAT